MRRMILLEILILFILCTPVAMADDNGKKVRTITISQGDLTATFRDNSESPGKLSGIVSLFNTKSAPGFNAFDPEGGRASAGINFEHIICGHANEHNAFSPRHGEYTLYESPPVFRDLDSAVPANDAQARNPETTRSVVWKRKASDDPWGVESSTKLTMTAQHYMDIEFKCRPTDASKFGSRGWAIFFWCNYMNDVAEVPLHFRGIEKEGGKETWILADASEQHKDWNTGGTYRNANATDLAYDADHNFSLNNWSYDWPRYTKPFYYGLTANGMVYMLMFDKSYTPEDEIRFSIFKFKLKTAPRPAWDYEYVIHKVQTGKEYGYRARVVYKEFVSAEDCLREYETWVAQLTN